MIIRLRAAKDPVKPTELMLKDDHPKVQQDVNKWASRTYAVQRVSNYPRRISWVDHNRETKRLTCNGSNPKVCRWIGLGVGEGGGGGNQNGRGQQEPVGIHSGCGLVLIIDTATFFMYF